MLIRLRFIFGPSIDGDLIPDSPHTLLEQGKFARIPFIAGNVLDECVHLDIAELLMVL